MAPVLAKFPHEARVQRFAYAALTLAAALATLVASQSPGAVLRYQFPVALPIVLIALGAVVGVVAVGRRSAALALAAGIALALAVVPGGVLSPGVLGFAEGLLLGGLILAFGELVHQTSRYDSAHQLIEEEGVSEDGLDRVTDEALKTLGERALLAMGLAAAPIVIALALAFVGPPAWREALETASTLGVGALAIAIFGGVAIFILARSGRLRSGTKTEQEVVAVADIDVVE